MVRQQAGAAYTFGAGPTVNIEYVHSDEGYGNAEADGYYALGRDVTQLLETGGARAGGAAAVLAQGLSPTRLLLRRNYFFAQYLHTNIRNNLDVTLRYTYNIDDGSSMFGPILAWNATDQLQMFALGVFNSGGSQREFGQLFHGQVMLGVQLFLQ